MLEAYNNLLTSFDKAIQKKEDTKFGKKDVDDIYKTASKLFDGTIILEQNQMNQIRDKLVRLTDGKLDKSHAMKKLQGTSRAEAIRSVLLSTI